MLERAEPERGRLDGFDGRYHYVCERGHRSVSDNPFYDTCTARGVKVENGVTEFTSGPCGADIDHRIVDYRGEGDVE